jgi:O-antigen biosynthesis protein
MRVISKGPQVDGPARMIEIDIAKPLSDVSVHDESTGKQYSRVVALVRLHARPLDLVELPASSPVVTAGQQREAIWQRLAEIINDHLRKDGLPVQRELGYLGLPGDGSATCQLAREELLADAPYVSIVIPTRNRTDGLFRTLSALNQVRYPRFEVIIVDNAASSDKTAILAQHWQAPYRIRYASEPRPGVSWARNRGWELADSQFVAFIDDDVTPDPDWLAELILGFSYGDHVVCVTGLILPRELETPAQIWFEQFGRLGKGFHRRLFDLYDNRPSDPLYPYVVGSFGSGANFAFQRSSLSALGGFDPALGTGTPAMGGEDIEICFRIIRNGMQISYQPNSLVYHTHQRDYEMLRQKSYSYGVGLTAFLTKSLLDRPERMAEVGRRLPFALNHILNPRSSKNRAKAANYPSELSRLELKGMLYGPIAYIRSRRHTANLYSALEMNKS